MFKNSLEEFNTIMDKIESVKFKTDQWKSPNLNNKQERGLKQIIIRVS